MNIVYPRSYSYLETWGTYPKRCVFVPSFASGDWDSGCPTQRTVARNVTEIQQKVGMIKYMIGYMTCSFIIILLSSISPFL